jgi:hypothetical protein
MGIQGTMIPLDSSLVGTWSYPVAANTVIKYGDGIVMAAGNAAPNAGAAAAIWAYATEDVNNNPGAAGAQRVNVKFFNPKYCHQRPLAAAGIPTAANVGALVYLDANGLVTTAATGDSCGRLVAIVEGKALYQVT